MLRELRDSMKQTATSFNSGNPLSKRADSSSRHNHSKSSSRASASQ